MTKFKPWRFADSPRAATKPLVDLLLRKCQRANRDAAERARELALVEQRVVVVAKDRALARRRLTLAHAKAETMYAALRELEPKFVYDVLEAQLLKLRELAARHDA